MARMHARRKGNSGSVHPPVKASPGWSEISPKEVEGKVLELAKEDKSQSEIGIILRDSYGVPSVKTLLGKTVKQILTENKVAGEYPEDLINLMSRAVRLRKHLESNKKDIHNTHSLRLTESKIRRLAKYYVRRGDLPQGWKYTPEQAALIVRER